MGTTILGNYLPPTSLNSIPKPASVTVASGSTGQVDVAGDGVVVNVGANFKGQINLEGSGDIVNAGTNFQGQLNVTGNTATLNSQDGFKGSISVAKDLRWNAMANSSASVTLAQQGAKIEAADALGGQATIINGDAHAMTTSLYTVIQPDHLDYTRVLTRPTPLPIAATAPATTQPAAQQDKYAGVTDPALLLQGLSDSLKAGNLTDAQSAYAGLQRLVTAAGANITNQTYSLDPLTEAFADLGRSLQAGNLDGARAAYGALQSGVKIAKQLADLSGALDAVVSARQSYAITLQQIQISVSISSTTMSYAPAYLIDMQA